MNFHITLIGLHGFIENGKEHQFFQLYTNQPREKVDLGSRWYDKCLKPESPAGGRIADDSGTLWYDSPPEPSKTETLLYRWGFYLMLYSHQGDLGCSPTLIKSRPL